MEVTQTPLIRPLARELGQMVLAGGRLSVGDPHLVIQRHPARAGRRLVGVLYMLNDTSDQFLIHEDLPVIAIVL